MRPNSTVKIEALLAALDRHVWRPTPFQSSVKTAYKCQRMGLVRVRTKDGVLECLLTPNGEEFRAAKLANAA